MERIIAKRQYGTAYEMSIHSRNLPYTISFTPQQFEKLKEGVVPMEMGDRWFVFYENSTLYCHWWSGQCIYKIHFNEIDLVSKEIIVVSDDAIKPIVDDETEIRELESLLRYSLLGGDNSWKLNFE